MESLTPTECKAKEAQFQAAAEEQQRAKQRKAAEQAAEAAKLQAERAESQRKLQQAVAEQLRIQKERGYTSVEFEDFQLDGKDLAARSSKVAIQGVYLKQGDAELLMPSQMAVALMRETGRTDQGIALLTENAHRSMRQFFLSCRNNVVGAQLGCQITILGRATMCERTTLLGRSNVPCVEVEAGWSIVPN